MPIGVGCASLRHAALPACAAWRIATPVTDCRPCFLVVDPGHRAPPGLGAALADDGQLLRTTDHGCQPPLAVFLCFPGSDASFLDLVQATRRRYPTVPLVLLVPRLEPDVAVSALACVDDIFYEPVQLALLRERMRFLIHRRARNAS